MNLFPDDLQPALRDFNAGRLASAEAFCQKRLARSPSGEIFFLLGLIANKSGRHAESVSWLERAAAALPPSERLFSALGGAYRAAGNLPKAAESFARCLQLDPDAAEARRALANVCYDLREYELAEKLFRAAVTADLQDAQSWNNLANTLRNLGHIQEALAAHQRARALCPEDALIRVNHGVTLLQAGQLAEGFREYESRWPVLKLKKFPQPVWRGEHLPDQTLFVFAEQGLGDTIQFARFLKLARERVGRVVLECAPSLKRLLGHSRVADVVVAAGETIPPFDVYLPLLHLPSVFQTTLETIPADAPYLTAVKKSTAPNLPDTQLRVGLVWSGNPAFLDDDARSIALETFSGQFEIPGINFVSLQKKIPARDETFFRTARFTKVMNDVNDFADTAALVAELDLVISVDTSVAHLAGALGKPCWTLLGWPSDWRWLCERRDSPWYPTMRLFRRRRNSDWASVLAEVTTALREQISRK